MRRNPTHGAGAALRLYTLNTGTICAAQLRPGCRICGKERVLRSLAWDQHGRCRCRNPSPSNALAARIQRREQQLVVRGPWIPAAPSVNSA